VTLPKVLPVNEMGKPGIMFSADCTTTMFPVAKVAVAKVVNVVMRMLSAFFVIYG
jgi:hypothetical protein